MQHNGLLDRVPRMLYKKTSHARCMADAVHRVTVDPDVGLLAALLAVEGREGRETCQENKSLS